MHLLRHLQVWLTPFTCQLLPTNEPQRCLPDGFPGMASLCFVSPLLNLGPSPKWSFIRRLQNFFGTAVVMILERNFHYFMKKLFFSSLAVAAVLVTSCSSKTTEKEATDEGAAIKAKIENCSDPDSLKIYVQQAKDYAAKLVKEGNDTAAQAYLNEVAPVVQTKDPTAVNIFDRLEAKADSTVNNAVEKADSLKDKAAAAAQAKVEEGKAKAAEAANEVKEKTAAAAETAKQKTADAAQSAADKVKNALGQ